ncbi:MAG TPA: hypothetical protein VF306_12350 [Pirellulales bacterium]
MIGGLEIVPLLDLWWKHHVDNRAAIDAFREAAAAAKRTRETLAKQYDLLLGRG